MLSKLTNQSFITLKNECSQRQLYSELPIRSLFLESKINQSKAEHVEADARIPEQVISRVNGRQWSNGSWRWTVFLSGLIFHEDALNFHARSCTWLFGSLYLLLLLFFLDSYFPFMIPMVRVIEKSSLSFSNSERHTLE